MWQRSQGGKALGGLLWVNYLIKSWRAASGCVQQFLHNTPGRRVCDRLGFEPWGEFKQVCDMKGLDCGCGDFGKKCRLDKKGSNLGLFDTQLL